MRRTLRHTTTTVAFWLAVVMVMVPVIFRSNPSNASLFVRGDDGEESSRKSADGGGGGNSMTTDTVVPDPKEGKEQEVKPGTEDENDNENDDEEDPSLFYFYRNDMEASQFVTEYEAPSSAGEKDRPDVLFQDEEEHPTTTIPTNEIRIVKFYAHWCPHCKRFFPKYVAMAQRVQELLEQHYHSKSVTDHNNNEIESTTTHPQKRNIKFYAVSCVPHKKLCRQYQIKSYPTIMMFDATTGTDPNNGVVLSKTDLHPFAILRKAGIVGADAENNNGNGGVDHDETFELLMNQYATKTEEDNKNNNNNNVGDGDTDNNSNNEFWLTRTKTDIYNDAYLSFVFAMENAIFIGQGPLSEDATKAFRNWIHLLQKTLPPTWKLSLLVNEIEDQLDEVVQDESKLEEILSRHPSPVRQWSTSCSRGDISQGYTCGLWQLFHITTIGFVQWRINNVGGKKFYSTESVGDTLSKYIEHFFACEVCRQNFLLEYEGCAYGRCDRLITKNGNLEDWKELPLWLSELHNGVNLRLMGERAEREGRVVTSTELESVQWPARKHCPSCWRDDGSWDTDKIYLFLLVFYWPEELIPKVSIRELLGSSSDIDSDEESGVESWVFSLVGFFLASTVLSAASCIHKKKLERTGRHKKNDDSRCMDDKV